MVSYLVHHVPTNFKLPENIGDWRDHAWEHVGVAEISHFHVRSSDFHPVAEARVMHDGKNLLVRFDVKDQYVICRRTKFQDAVFKDSAVEFFFRPKPGAGYFNLEVNCGGTMLMSNVEDAAITKTGSSKFTDVSATDAGRITIHHSMPRVVNPEITTAANWRIGEIIPMEVLERYVGRIGDLRGQVWTGNFYKCAEENSHPHWASWSPIGEKLSFHQPRYFGELRFE